MAQRRKHSRSGKESFVIALVTLSVLAAALFAWIALGGQPSLKPREYRFKQSLTHRQPSLKTARDMRGGSLSVAHTLESHAQVGSCSRSPGPRSRSPGFSESGSGAAGELT